ncbi:uncharacterized protein LOC128999835 [Macrosteles quadrilineatus]|uniref:uncharacterized protein LOC128999835 n=1 Tax=Macrosteles quadrilineatus TaxID=74068 RepID=UPI0023E0AD55|nr:uncharacterized protein LOC128999835 [Macrosteles quadrilineatus]
MASYSFHPYVRKESDLRQEKTDHKKTERPLKMIEPVTSSSLVQEAQRQSNGLEEILNTDLKPIDPKNYVVSPYAKKAWNDAASGSVVENCASPLTKSKAPSRPPPGIPIAEHPAFTKAFASVTASNARQAPRMPYLAGLTAANEYQPGGATWSKASTSASTLPAKSGYDCEGAINWTQEITSGSQVQLPATSGYDRDWALVNASGFDATARATSEGMELGAVSEYAPQAPMYTNGNQSYTIELVTVAPGIQIPKKKLISRFLPSPGNDGKPGRAIRGRGAELYNMDPKFHPDPAAIMAMELAQTYAQRRLLNDMAAFGDLSMYGYF